MKRKYDFVFSLGAACLCSQTLRNARLQYASFPLDWVYGGGMALRTDLVLNGFSGWFEQGDFALQENPDAFGHDPYVNVRTGMLFPHEFDKGVPIAESYPAVRARMDRRAARLRERLLKSRRVLIVWIGDPRDTHRLTMEEMEDCIRRFESSFSQTAFELLAIDRVPGVSGEGMRRYEREKIRFYGFDYKDYGVGAADWHYHQEMLAPFFTDIRVADYRTREEKVRFVARQFENECARFGASSRLTLRWKKLKYKIGKHFAKRS